MEVFLSNLPPDLTDKSLKLQLLPCLEKLHITDWACRKPRGKKFGHLIFLRRADGETFLTIHSEQAIPGQQQRNGQPRTRSRLSLLHSAVYCRPSNNEPDAFLLKSLDKAADDRAQEEDQPEPEKPTAVVFDLQGILCGHYDYPDNNLTFTPDIEWPVHGVAKFARHMLVVTFGQEFHQIRLEIPYRIINEIVVSTHLASLFLTLWEPPRILRDENRGLLNSMRYFGISNVPEPAAPRIRLTEIPHNHGNHGSIIGQSLVYRVAVSPVDFHLKVDQLKVKQVLALTYHQFSNPLFHSARISEGLARFNEQLGKYSKTVPFDILFQFQVLVQNGYLVPQTVERLLRRLRQLATLPHGETPQTYPVSAAAVRGLLSQIPFPGPGYEASTFDADEVWSYIEANEREARQGLKSGLISERARQNLVDVFRVEVTPTRITIHGPEPEAKNRILRKFPHHSEFFARVQFCEEDGQDLYFNTKVSLEEIWSRFKRVLRQGIPIAGRVYNFLGFSHSSLRAHAAWFVAPFHYNNDLQTHFSIISDLGKFKHITSPARCAARIGQAFSETPFSVSLEDLGVVCRNIPDVKSEDGSRVFSDGVGTMSQGLMEAVQEQLPQKSTPPTCFQIRWAGAKGMLAYDPTLEGMFMCIRKESMVKFESNDVANLEICDTNSRPIPLVLNRQMIKILEDLGVSEDWLFKCQNRELRRLQKITALVDNTVEFLKRQRVADQIRFFKFIRRLSKLGIDYKEDQFLCSVVEAVVLRELRLLKHKARIPVEKGVTLFGVMDEYNFLGEDDVFVTFDGLPGTDFRDLHNRAVMLTRSPALHPGDIQTRRAVVPPEWHPLRSLSNCVVFSQQGDRDLPSQLSGGDLDGDIFNIIWDDDAVSSCTREFPPADYPRVPPLDIGREVTREDMTDFFVNFMATDQLGLIAVKHMILSDQKEAGTVDEECKILAQMHSTGVDYSKTGVPVDMSLLGKLSSSRYRPDFLAPAPPANIKDRSEISFDAPARVNIEDEDDFTGPVYDYYKSDKVLGKLYRAIDERKIWRDNIRLAVKRIGGPSVWDRLLLYFEEECTNIGGINWEPALAEARRIRHAYDDAIFNACSDFSEHPSIPITELEVFVGCIFNKSGVQTRRQRDKSTKLKDEFDRISRWAESVIRRSKNRKPIHVESEEYEEDHQPALDQDISALELSIACVHVGTVQSTVAASSRMGEEFQSFKVVAAHCALAELDLAVKRKEIAAGAAVMSGGYVGVANAARR